MAKAPRALTPFAELPDFQALEARRRDTVDDLAKIEADIVENRRRLDDNWRDMVASAIAKGESSPPRPALADLDDNLERAQTLRLALGKIRRAQEELTDRESRRVLAETSEVRGDLVRRMNAAMLELIAAEEAYSDHRERLAEAGVRVSIIEWYTPRTFGLDPAEYRRRALEYLGVSL
jgi:hypothetical protein